MDFDWFLDLELKDDETEEGGIAFAGETVKDFCESVAVKELEVPKVVTLSWIIKVLKALEECGIEV